MQRRAHHPKPRRLKHASHHPAASKRPHPKKPDGRCCIAWAGRFKTIRQMRRLSREVTGGRNPWDRQADAGGGIGARMRGVCIDWPWGDDGNGQSSWCSLGLLPPGVAGPVAFCCPASWRLRWRPSCWLGWARALRAWCWCTWTILLFPFPSSVDSCSFLLSSSDIHAPDSFPLSTHVSPGWKQQRCRPSLRFSLSRCLGYYIWCISLTRADEHCEHGHHADTDDTSVAACPPRDGFAWCVCCRGHARAAALVAARARARLRAAVRRVVYRRQLPRRRVRAPALAAVSVCYAGKHGFHPWRGRGAVSGCRGQVWRLRRVACGW